MEKISSSYDSLQHGEYWFDRSTNVRIHYVVAMANQPSTASAKAETIILVHGFPQTSYQFRHVIPMLSDAGYNVIAPDYRGAGLSSHPTSPDFTKATMASDIFKLVYEHLGITDRVHVVGHDIGGMVAYAYALAYPQHVRSLVWGECPLPGTAVWERHMRDPSQFHFHFHRIPQLAGALIEGRERTYLKHFFDKLTATGNMMPAITEEDLARYVSEYAQSGAMQCVFETYAAFDNDAENNRISWRKNVLCARPTLLLNGAESRHAAEAKEMLDESSVSSPTNMISVIKSSGHYLAEENPEGFSSAIISFLESIPSD